MNSEQDRAGRRREHSSASEISRNAAIALWRNADTNNKRRQAAIAVVSNVTSYEMLTGCMGDEAPKVWTDAGRELPK